ncbi:hypothetical protein MNBD_GAMMA12-1126 [hydrothermal vent metagenome]|uniref:Uncharacterized protein n=1 Tax=hydrothermal vent metagenome TaxID=652676 RepID=A0A3B0YLJ1_9ZZZZ
MEEKNETSQGDNGSGSSPVADDKSSTASANKSTASSGNKGPTSSSNGVADKIIADVKKFNMMSLVGLGIVIFFMFLMFFDGTKYKWWLMLPLAGAAAFILYRQLSDTQGFEKKACFYGLIIIGVLVLLRDIQISNTYENYRSYLYKYSAQATQAKNFMNNIKASTVKESTK